MNENCKLILGDCLEKMKEIPDNSIDLVLTDPPYGLEFMGKSWDKWEDNFNYKWASACFPKLKAGAFLVFTMTPRQDLLWRCLAGTEKAGYELKTSGMYWLYHTGFPKALDISKAIDKKNNRTEESFVPFGKYLKEKRIEKDFSMNQIDSLLGTNTAYSWWEGRKAGIQLPSKSLYLKLKEVLGLDNRFDKLIERIEAEREVIGINQNIKGRKLRNIKTLNVGAGAGNDTKITEPNLSEACKWQGWKSFQLKPAVECIIVAQKPREQKTITGQVLENGCGAVNIGECRIPYANDSEKEKCGFHGRTVDSEIYGKYGCSPARPNENEGRFPANLIVQDNPLQGEGKGNGFRPNRQNHNKTALNFKGFSGDKKTVGVHLNEYPDSGSTNRFYSLDAWAEKRNITLAKNSAFFDVPKPSKAEKNTGLEEVEEKKQRMNGANSHNCFEQEGSGRKTNTLNKNNHPTCKPVTLFRYLATLFCQPNGTILDPFMGSGTTGIAVLQENKKFIGIEKEEEYFKIAKARIAELKHQTRLVDSK